MSPRLALPARRHHLTQKVKIAGQRTLYIIVPDDEYPTELFLRQNVGPLIKSPIEPCLRTLSTTNPQHKGKIRDGTTHHGSSGIRVFRHQLGTMSQWKRYQRNSLR
jgi:hypothetical protein